MQNTLPLFESSSDQGFSEQTLPDQMNDLPVNQRQGHGAPSNSCPTAPGDRLRTKPASSGSTGPEQHLQAARRLSRRIRRYPDGSVEQTRAGLAICRHLQALLAQSDRRAGQP
jgi:hypothetical protein